MVTLILKKYITVVKFAEKTFFHFFKWQVLETAKRLRVFGPRGDRLMNKMQVWR